MARIYLINVGANTSHAWKARGPVFLGEEEAFEFVPYPDKSCKQKCPRTLVRYVKPAWFGHLHLDPDWEHLTYGDYCYNRRARALLRVRDGDILLFLASRWQG
jgi:hypothetical protein